MATTKITDTSFEQDVLKSSGLTLVDFWAEWCGPCRALGPKLEEISDEHSDKVTVAKINIDDNPEAPAKYQVRGIPTMILFKNGEVVEQLVGNYSKEAIVDAISKHS